MGVKEYFSYDPRLRLPQSRVRLRGWRTERGFPVQLAPRADGRLWSEELKSWLVPDGAKLRLFDSDGDRRETRWEAERAAKERACVKLVELGIDPSSLRDL